MEQRATGGGDAGPVVVEEGERVAKPGDRLAPSVGDGGFRDQATAVVAVPGARREVGIGGRESGVSSGAVALAAESHRVCVSHESPDDPVDGEPRGPDLGPGRVPVEVCEGPQQRPQPPGRRGDRGRPEQNHAPLHLVHRPRSVFAQQPEQGAELERRQPGDLRVVTGQTEGLGDRSLHLGSPPGHGVGAGLEEKAERFEDP
jgi:hypothetical protein